MITPFIKNSWFFLSREIGCEFLRVRAGTCVLARLVGSGRSHLLGRPRNSQANLLAFESDSDRLDAELRFYGLVSVIASLPELSGGRTRWMVPRGRAQSRVLAAVDRMGIPRLQFFQPNYNRDILPSGEI